MVNQVVQCLFLQDMHSTIDITPRSKKYLVIQGRHALKHPWRCGTASEAITDDRPILIFHVTAFMFPKIKNPKNLELFNNSIHSLARRK